MPTNIINSNGPASAGSPFAVTAQNLRMDNDRGLILLKFPGYELDATELLYSDTYTQYDNLMVQTLNGDYINLGNYVKKTEFNDYYPSILTELEFRNKIANYYTKKESNDLLQNIRDNYVTNVSFNSYKDTQRQIDDEINTKIQDNLNAISNINNVVIPTLKTIDSFNTDIARYTDTAGLNRILATYTNTSGLNTLLDEIRNTHTTYKQANDTRSQNIETLLADTYNKTWINDKFNLYYTKKENDVRYNTLDTKIKKNISDINTINNDINTIYRDKVDLAVFNEFKDDSYRKAEVDKKITDVNAYTKPEMNSIVSTINSNIDNALTRINDTNTRISNMYTNLQHDTRHNSLDYRITTNFNSIEDIKSSYTTLTNFNNEVKKINDALNVRYTKTELNNIIFENNKKFYTKEDMDNKSSNVIANYDITNRAFIAKSISDNNLNYLALIDFNLYKDTVFDKNEVNDLFTTNLSNYDTTAVNDIKHTNLYNKTKTEYTKLVNDTIQNYYDKPYVDTEFAKYRTRDDDNEYIKNTLKLYVTEEKFTDTISNVPSLQTVSDTIYNKLEENNTRLNDTIETTIDNKMLIFYDYLLNNTGIFYTKQIMDLRLDTKEDKTISILRYNYLNTRIDKFYKKFITYYTKDEVDSKFTYYFSNANIADATLYYTSVETDRFLNEKVDKTTYQLFYDNTYNKTYVDTELNKKVNISVYNSEMLDLHNKDTEIETKVDDLTQFINGTLTNDINTRITGVETSLGNRITANENNISTLTTRTSDLVELAKTFKNEAQVNALITAITDNKVDKVDYELDKTTFAKLNEFNTLKNNLDNNYTKTVDMVKKIKDVSDIVPSDIKINDMIDAKITTYNTSNTLSKVIDDKISSNSNALHSTITSETDTKLNDYPTLTFLSTNNYTKVESDNKRNELKREFTTKYDDLNSTLETYKTFVADNYLKLTGGSVNGNVSITGDLKVCNYVLNNDGFKITNNTTDFIIFNTANVTGNTQKDINIGSDKINVVTIGNTSDLIHRKYNTVENTQTDYKIITEEVFKPFKDTIYTKIESNNLLDKKVDKTTYNSTISNMNDTLATKDELNDYKDEMSATLDNYHTITDYQKHVSDNYVNNITFNNFKTDISNKVNNDLSTKLEELKTDTKSKLDTLSITLDDNVDRVNTEITGKITTLENNTYNKTYVDTELNKKADKTHLNNVLYSGVTQPSYSLDIGSVAVKISDDNKNIYTVVDGSGIKMDNKSDNINRNIINMKYGINEPLPDIQIGDNLVRSINILGNNLQYGDSEMNLSPVVTERKLTEVQNSIVSNMRQKDLELEGKINTSNNNIKTNTDNITEIFKELAKKESSTDVTSKLYAKLDKSGGNITGEVTFTNDGKITLNNNNDIKIGLRHIDNYVSEYGMYRYKDKNINLIEKYTSDVTTYSDYSYINESDSYFFLNPGYEIYDSTTMGSRAFKIKNSDTQHGFPASVKNIYFPTNNIYVPYSDISEDNTAENTHRHYKLDRLVTESILNHMKDDIVKTYTSTLNSTKSELTTASTDLETKLKKYVDDQISAKLDEIGKILDKINGA